MRTPAKPARYLLVLSLVLTSAELARAGGGYFSGTKGARSAGRAGAFTAKADDLSAAATNPAGYGSIGGLELMVGNRFSYNASSFERSPTLDWGNLQNGVPPYVEFARAENELPWQLLDPLLGVGSNLGLDGWGFAYFVYAPPGIGHQRFPVDGGQRYMMVEREVIVINHTANVAYQFLESFGVGVSLQWIFVPQLNYALVIDANQFPGDVNPVSSEFDMLATLEGSDPFTLNAVVGAWYRPVPFLELGLAGQVIPTKLETNSTLAVTPLSTGIEDEVVLRRSGVDANDVKLRLPLPLTARAGVRYRHLAGDNEVFDVEFDVVYETWSRVDKFTVDGDGLRGTLLAQTLDVGLIEIDKQWKDTVSLQLGSDVVAIPDLLTVRGGVFYDSAVSNPSHANVDFVSGDQLGGAVGSSVTVGPAEVAVAYEYRHQPPVRVSEGDARVFQEVPGSQCDPPYTDEDTCHPEFLGRRSAPANAGVYRAHSHVVSLDVLYQF